jgi:hypothetical protein
MGGILPEGKNLGSLYNDFENDLNPLHVNKLV